MLARIDSGRQPEFEIVRIAKKSTLADLSNQKIKSDLFHQLPFRVSILPYNLSEAFSEKGILANMLNTDQADSIRHIVGTEDVTELNTHANTITKIHII